MRDKSYWLWVDNNRTLALHTLTTQGPPDIEWVELSGVTLIGKCGPFEFRLSQHENRPDIWACDLSYDFRSYKLRVFDRLSPRSEWMANPKGHERALGAVYHAMGRFHYVSHIFNQP